MIHLFHGPNTAKIEKAIAQTTKKIDPDEVVQIKETQTAKFFNAITGQSLFAKKTVVVAKNVISNMTKEQRNDFTNVVKENKINNQTVVILHEDKILKTTKAYKSIKKTGETYNYTNPTPQEIQKIIHTATSQNGYSIDFQAAQELAFRVGTNTSLLKNELEKLYAYTAENKTITSQDITKLIQSNTEERVFDFTEAVATGNTAEALRLYNKMIATDDPIKLVALIAYQFRTLLKIKEATTDGLTEKQIAKEEKLHPFVVQKGKRMAQNLSLGKLKRMLQFTLLLDKNLKTGTDKHHAFETFIININK